MALNVQFSKYIFQFKTKMMIQYIANGGITACAIHTQKERENLRKTVCEEVRQG